MHEATLSDLLDLTLHLKAHYSVHKSILMYTLMTETYQVHLYILID